MALVARPESGLDWFGHGFDWPNSFPDLLGPDLGWRRRRFYCMDEWPRLSGPVSPSKGLCTVITIQRLSVYGVYVYELVWCNRWIMA